MREETWDADFAGSRVELRRCHEGTLFWSAARNGVAISEPSRLHLVVDGVDVLTALPVGDGTSRRVREAYDMVLGKQVGRHVVEHEETSVVFELAVGSVTVVMRAASDGVALRMVIHGRAGACISGSDVALEFPPAARTWPLTYTPWYETTRFSTSLDRLDNGDYGLPFLVEVADHLFALVSESDLDGRYGGSLARSVGEGRIELTLTDDVVLADDDVPTPWRVLLIGSLAEIVASNLVNDLAPPAEGVPEWVSPGRAGWSWWSDFYSGAHLDKQLALLDYVSDRGWEYLLVDCGWDPAWMPELVSAASARGVGVFVWIAWDRLVSPSELAQLEEWANWGIAGIKVDFMESEAQERYRWYDAVIAETRRCGLMVNFHGSVIPRGWQRTFPHVVSFEAVRGAEYYVFYGDPLTAEHNTIVPFTRNVVGSADYTPVTFSAKDRVTSDGHELALSVVLESGVTHFADNVSEYAKRPLAERFLERVPAAWDETRLVGGEPGSHAVLARRRGDEWFVGVISATPATTLELPLAFLPAGVVRAEAVLDGPAGDLLERTWLTAATDTLTLDLVANGGAVVVLTADDSPSATLGTLSTPTSHTAPTPSIRPHSHVLTATPGAVLIVSADATNADVVFLRVPPAWPPAVVIESLSTASVRCWQVAVPPGATPGQVQVATIVASAAHRPRDVVAHVRLVGPLAVGSTPVSSLRPVSSANGYGPVEIDMSNGGGDPRDGRPMSVAGTAYEMGLGVCAPSEVLYHVGGSCHRFTVSVGVDDETADGAAATCAVVADGRVLSLVDVTYGAAAVDLDIDLTDVTSVTLQVLPPAPGEPAAHVDWARATFHARPPR